MVTPGYAKWRRKILKRDRGECQCCGSTKSPIIHHKDGYHWCIDRRIDLENGTVMCKICHDDFHNTYGWSYNTEEQYNEYKKEIENLMKKSRVL